MSYLSPIHHDRRAIAASLSAAILACRWTRDDVSNAIRQTLKSKNPLCDTLATSIIACNETLYPPSPRRLIDLLWEDDAFHQLCEVVETRPVVLKAVLNPPFFNPSPRFTGLDIPPVTTEAALADWFDIDLRHLEWFAGSRQSGEQNDIPVLQHYRYSFVAKKSDPPRIIEAPKPRLKGLQKSILREILDKVQPHNAVHGFVRGRSVLSSAQIHGGEQIVLVCDLKDFFLSTPVRRVHGVFRSLGYPWSVARLLTELCVSAMPARTFRRLPPGKRHDRRTRQRYGAPHLPAGAPTSPALANLAAFRLDLRLAGLARTLDANYTRYADDLTFSGGAKLHRRASAFLKAVAKICAEEGYAINDQKTRLMPQSKRQQVTGIVVNSHNNFSRSEFDRLKAILHHCVRRGPKSQNRNNHTDFRAHLEGLVTWAENINPHRARKLRALFDQIDWQ